MPDVTDNDIYTYNHYSSISFNDNSIFSCIFNINFKNTNHIRNHKKSLRSVENILVSQPCI